MTTWTRRAALGLVLIAAGGCEVSTGDDFPDSGLGARGGATGSGARGGSGGSAGTAGSANTGGSAGTGEVIDSGLGGSGGSDFEAPTCNEEEADAIDACLECVKQQCCTEWLGCNDQTCFNEWDSVNICMQDIDEPTEDDFFECASVSAESEEMIVQDNTNELLGCMREEVENDAGVPSSRCGLPCFGVEILF